MTGGSFGKPNSVNCQSSRWPGLPCADPRPPASARYSELLQSTHATQRQILREKGTPAAELGLLDPSATTDQTLDAMVANPVLVDRPTNVTRQGVKPCRP